MVFHCSQCRLLACGGTWTELLKLDSGGDVHLRGAWSVERGAWSVERGAWSVERSVRSAQRANDLGQLQPRDVSSCGRDDVHVTPRLIVSYRDRTDDAAH